MLTTDETLLIQLHQGSKAAFTQLYNLYQPGILRYLIPFTQPDSALAEEIVQEVFVRLWTRRAHLEHVRSLEPYLKKMARNHLLNMVRAQRIKQRHEAMSLNSQDEWAVTTEDDFRFKEYYRLTREALLLLPERRRYLFQLSTVEGYSLDEIVSMTNLSRAVVKKQLTLTNQFLRKYLQEKGGLPINAGFLLLCCLLSDWN